MLKTLLDNPTKIKKLDTLSIYDSILGLKRQVGDTWNQITVQNPPKSCSSASNIIISGMGGSALGGRIIQSLSQFFLKAPLEIITNYRLPAYANQKSLVIVSSYSGNTEETISALLDAISRKCQIFVITQGGKLAEIAAEHRLPSHIFTPTHNPSGQPRLGLGYSITAQLSLLAHCQFINFHNQDVLDICDHLDTMTKYLEVSTPTKSNPAKSLAQKSKDKALIIISANHLTGTAHAIKNMLNENAKTFATSFDLPELNHHLLEGLSFPKDLKENTHFLLINSDLYPKVIRDRFEITKHLLTKLHFPLTVIKPDSQKSLVQVFESLYFGEFFSYYLGLQNQIDPGPIPWVNYFKEELNKQSKRI